MTRYVTPARLYSAHAWEQGVYTGAHRALVVQRVPGTPSCVAIGNVATTLEDLRDALRWLESDESKETEQ